MPTKEDNHNVSSLSNPDTLVHDPLTDLLHVGARKLITQTVETEISLFLEHFKDLKLPDGRQQIVRNGHLPERKVQTGIGPVKIKVPRARDRAPQEESTRFHSNLLPPYMKKTKRLEELIPWLYLKGVSTGQMSEALAVSIGQDASGLSANTVSRLKDQWTEEFEPFRVKDLSKQACAYIWVDGFYPAIRMEESRHYLLVVNGVMEDGSEQFLLLTDGFRESEQSWKEILLNLQYRGLNAPCLAVGDGALGFWNALKKIFPETKMQRCWVHKTKNVLDKLSKSEQRKAKQRLKDIYLASTRQKAERALDLFVSIYNKKYLKAAQCLKKDRVNLLTFYDFPGGHWVHLRTTNPIESSFATIKLRTSKTKGCCSKKTGLAMVYKCSMSAQKKWRKVRSPGEVTDILSGIPFKDGERIDLAA